MESLLFVFSLLKEQYIWVFVFTLRWTARFDIADLSGESTNEEAILLTISINEESILVTVSTISTIQCYITMLRV